MLSNHAVSFSSLSDEKVITSTAAMRPIKEHDKTDD